MTDRIQNNNKASSELNIDDWLTQDDLEFEDPNPRSSRRDDYTTESNPSIRNLGNMNMSPAEARNYLFSLLDSETNASKRNQIQGLIRELGAQRGRVNPELMREIALLDAEQVHASTRTGSNAGESDGSVSGRVNALKAQIDASDLPNSQKTSFKNRLDRALHLYELNGTDQNLESLEQTMSEIEASFNEASTVSPRVVALANAINKPVEEVQSALGDLVDSLDPNAPPSQALMDALRQLDIPKDSQLSQVADALDKYAENVRSTKETVNGQMREWMTESEHVPDSNEMQTAITQFKREDSQSVKAKNALTSMRTDLMRALNALGYQATAGTHPNEMKIRGASFYFYDENTKSLTSSTTPTTLEVNPSDFPSFRRNTETSSTGDWEWFRDHEGSLPTGYPRGGNVSVW